MNSVVLEPAGADRIATLANLFQLYTHDFSEHWAGTDEGELEEDGRFAPYPYLESYWSDADRVPLLLRAAGRLAGFCLINRHHHGARPVDWNVAEFFVVRKHRRAGVGAAAATAVFQARPGVWEVAVARRNTGALVFWRGVIESQPGLSALHELDDASDWDGTVFRFRIG
ncbi:GNAT family N-acetyltransferase [Phenylobacterium terrae]|uniref:GNAT family N-acetyltransferase n=1 Tax=Phenylobacterium terrae TaxID=2665495 RepID=A0ABW4N3P7_9CAUL